MTPPLTQSDDRCDGYNCPYAAHECRRYTERDSAGIDTQWIHFSPRDSGGREIVKCRSVLPFVDRRKNPLGARD